MFTEQWTQANAVLGQIQPQTLNGSSANVNSIDGQKAKRIVADVNIGSNSGSLTGKWQASASPTTGFTDIAGTTFTAVTAANQVVRMEIRSDQIPAGKRYLNLVLTEGNSANCVVGALVYGGESHYKPASQFNVTAVAQTNVVASS